MKRRTRRWGRILFNTLTAISLLLALATAGLWVRSYGTLVFDFAINAGKIGIICQLIDGQADVRIFTECSDEFWALRGTPQVSDRFVSVIPFSLARQQFSGGRPRFYTNSYRVAPAASPVVCDVVGIPAWFVVSIASVLPSIRLLLAITRRSYPKVGHCPACGYDTRANPAKCSECGHEIAANIS